ncbi:MAG: hypothetical protein D6744_05035 [Planctomycetota bacterium]|nr:MAG: hypothetical protein D6744_05035 [Planctomycetota bacterium]
MLCSNGAQVCSPRRAPHSHEHAISTVESTALGANGGGRRVKRHSIIDEAWRTPLAQAGLSDPFALLDVAPADGALPGRWEALTKPGLGGRQRWRWRIDEPQPATLYVKRYARPTWREQWDRILRQDASHSRACWEFTQAQRLRAAHVPAAPAIAYAEEMLGRFERRSAVALVEAPGDAFDRFWRAASAQHAPITRGAARHDITRRLARFVAAFHGAGLCHRDLYLCHLFVDADFNAARSPRITVIDLARAHRPRWRRMRWIIKDLSQLDYSARQIGATRTDRLRFLLAYLGLSARSPRAHWYARKVLRKSNAIAARQARKSGG